MCTCTHKPQTSMIAFTEKLFKFVIKHKNHQKYKQRQTYFNTNVDQKTLKSKVRDGHMKPETGCNNDKLSN